MPGLKIKFEKFINENSKKSSKQETKTKNGKEKPGRAYDSDRLKQNHKLENCNSVS